MSADETSPLGDLRLVRAQLSDAGVEVRRVCPQPRQSCVDEQAGQIVASEVLDHGQPTQLHIRLLAVVERRRSVGASSLIASAAAARGFLVLPFQDPLPVPPTGFGMLVMREGNQTYRPDRRCSSRALARLDDVAVLVSHLELLRLVDAGVDDPMTRPGVICVELILERYFLFLDEDALANLHGVEKRPGDRGRLCIMGNACLERLELARLEQGDEGSAHGG
ncbi:hypothetical protein TCAP_00124 [Tolypocladium capitatum]|uniref:Uncharacterized protein n=1 Tax=Tolypocladium capitatum TaxID=45235 RepID=A0A2K3QR16_9HYPO|nr:hypothetical protein TCAP_00124 [Tolypocladium capitatum]